MVVSLENSAHFDHLAEQGRRELLAAVYQRVGNWADAEDIVQHAHLKVYRCLENLRSWENLRSYLFRAALRLTVDHWKNRRTHPTISLEVEEGLDEEGLGTYDLVDPHLGPVLLMEQQDLWERVGVALREINPDQSQVLLLYHVRDWDVQKIADFLGVPRGTVKSRLFRGRESLRRLMPDDC